MKPEARKILTDELNILKERVIQNHIAAGQKASGKTIQAFTVAVDDNAGTLYGRKFVGTLETGRKPGRVPKNFRAIIEQWAKDKGITVDKPKSFAYFVAKKIATEGTKLFRHGGRDDIYSTEIPKTIESILEKLGDNYRTEILQILNNQKVEA